MGTREHTIDGVTFYGTLAETAANISKMEWAYFRFSDKLSDMISEYMDERNITKASLARELGTSRAYISKVLAGDAHNMTIKTLSNILFSLNARLECKLVPKDNDCIWFGVIKNNCFPDNQVTNPWPDMKKTKVCECEGGEGLSPERGPLAA